VAKIKPKLFFLFTLAVAPHSAAAKDYFFLFACAAEKRLSTAENSPRTDLSNITSHFRLLRVIRTIFHWLFTRTGMRRDSNEQAEMKTNSN
jgi:hypothetical protein